MTSGNDGEVTAWDVERGRIAERFTGQSGEVWGLDVTADGRTLVTSATDGRAIVWDLAGDRRLDRRFTVGAPLDTSIRAAWFVVDVTRGLAISPDGSTLAVTRSGGAVDLIDARTLRRRQTIQAMQGFAGNVAFSPDGRLLAVVGRNGRITLWNARTLRSAGELRGLRADAQALAFSPDGRFLAAAEALFTPPRMRVWDVRRRELTRFRSDSAPSGSLAFSPDGRWVAAENGFGADVLDARSGRLVKSVEIDGASRSVAFSPDGSRLVIGSSDGTIHFFSTDDWSGGGPAVRGSRGTGHFSRLLAGRPGARHRRGRRDGCALGRARRGSRSGHRSPSSPRRPLPPSSARTARTSSRSQRAVRASGSTPHRRPGSATPASSPDATSAPASGRTRSPTGRTGPSARATERGPPPGLAAMSAP